VVAELVAGAGAEALAGVDERGEGDAVGGVGV
jgi:hypothetical protein